MAEGRMSWEELQRRLKTAGYYDGEIDGDPWTKTRAAVVEALVDAGKECPDPVDPDVVAKAEALDELRDHGEAFIRLLAEE